MLYYSMQSPKGFSFRTETHSYFVMVCQIPKIIPTKLVGICAFLMSFHSNMCVCVCDCFGVSYLRGQWINSHLCETFHQCTLKIHSQFISNGQNVLWINYFRQKIRDAVKWAPNFHKNCCPFNENTFLVDQ